MFQDENDVYILTKVSDILHSVFCSYREKVLPWFEQLLQLIVQLTVSNLWPQTDVGFMLSNGIIGKLMQDFSLRR